VFLSVFAHATSGHAACGISGEVCLSVCVTDLFSEKPQLICSDPQQTNFGT